MRLPDGPRVADDPDERAFAVAELPTSTGGSCSGAEDVTLALEFNDAFDLTAIGTLALALVTAVSLAFGWKSLRQGQKEVEEAHRPVLIPLADTVKRIQRAHFSPVTAKPYVLPEEGLLIVPIQNIGSGPALHVEAGVSLLNPSGGWTGATGGEQTPGTITGVGVLEVVPLELGLSRLSDVPGYELTVRYEDVAGKPWETVGRWIPEHKRYEGVAIRKGRSR
ncbi:MAG TPA: hypothetical protein VLJ80_09675 [Solirubrobacteraceae bacterium]|nr:hypothetical protein [Solirubrobacteraceae bacterium]